MKNGVFLLTVLFILSAESVSAQGWLNKVIKVTDNVEKTLDAIGGTETQLTTSSQTRSTNSSKYHFVEAFNNVLTYTNDTKVPVRFVSSIRNGEEVTIEFEIGNYTETDLEIRKFGSTKKQGFTLTEASSISDNTGRSYELYSATIGGKTEIKYAGTAWVNGFFNLHRSTSLKANMVIKGVSASTTSFQLVKIAFNNSLNGAYYTRYFTFKNVPILSVTEIARLEQEYLEKEFQKLLAKANAGDANAQYEVGTIYYNNGDVVKCIDYYTKSADAGNADAQGQIACLYLYGHGDYLTPDLNKALIYAQKGKVQGSVSAYYTLGVMYARGEGVDENKDKALEYLTYAANREYVDAQQWLGILYTNKDKTLSAQWYKKAADNGGVFGISNTGINYLSGNGLPVDNEKALLYFLKGVDRDDAECLYYAGLMYRRGWGCNQDLTKAKELLSKSAAQGNGDSFRELAFFYQQDEQDDLKAFDYFNRAIAQGDTCSLPYLAEMYEKGIGTLTNPNKAKELYTQSAEKGDKYSQYKLGMMAKKQNDFKVAFNWFGKSADAGHPNAQYELGLMYYYAKGTIKNSKKAAEYIEKAYKQGNKDAEKVWNNLQLWKYM